MSIQTAQSNFDRTQREIQSLQQKLTDKHKKEASKTERIYQINRSINQSPSSVQSKLRDIDSAQREIVAIQKKKADLQKQIADKTATLHRYQQETSAMIRYDLIRAGWS